MSDSPAVILFSKDGFPVAVVFDGQIYRLQSDSRLTDGYSYVGITNVAPGIDALKVDVVKTVSSGSVGIGGTSSDFADPYPIAGTAVGFSDGYFMRSGMVYDLNTGAGVEYTIGVNLRSSNLGGSLELGTLTNPLRIDPIGNTIQPISGTITSLQGTLPWTVQDIIADGYLNNILDNQTNGTQHTIIDGYVQTNPNVNVLNFPANQTISGTVTANQGTNPWTTDVNDRAARLLGVIYGSQGQQLKQTATNFNAQVELAVGAALIDPRQIRALTSSDVVTANAGTGNFTVVQSTASNLNATVTGTITSNQGTNPWIVKDTVADGYLQSILANQTNGTQQVIVDGYVQTNPNINVINIPTVNQGTNPWITDVTDRSVRLLGHVSVDGYVQTNPVIQGTVTSNQGTANTLSNAWPVEITDGSNVLGTVSHPIQANIDGYVQTNPNVNVNNFPSQQHVVVDGYVQTNPNVIATGHVSIDGYVQTNPNVNVSGTVTANIGTTNGLALNTTLTNGTQHTIVDGYVQTNPNVNVNNFPSQQHVIVDGYALTGLVVADHNTDFNWTPGQQVPLMVSTDGHLQVDVSDVAVVSGTVSVTQTPNIDGYNSSTTPLAGNASFTGTGVDVSIYGLITVFVFADKAGTLKLEFSTDNSNWDNIISYNIPASDAEHVQIGPQARYFRVVYTNGSAAQSTFRLQTIEKPITAFNPTIPLSSVADANGDAVLTKSVITGRTSNSTVIDNNYTDVLVNQSGNLSVYLGDTSNVSAFGRVRTADPLTLFSSKQLYDSQPLYWDDQQTSGSGTSSTFLTNQAATKMIVTGNVAGTRTRQSFRRMNYQPSKGQLCLFTGVLANEGGSGNTGVNRRIGLFDGYNGYFFELSETTMNVAIRTNSSGTPTTTYTAQSSWNLDKFDGYGASGILLDVSRAQIFIIDFQWLGVGRIRYGFDIGGVTHYAHQTLISNTQSSVSISIPNLPVRYEIQSLGTGSATSYSMQHICSAVVSEGGQQDTGFIFGVDTGAVQLTTGNDTNVYALLAIQLKPGVLSATVEPTFFTIASSTANAQFRAILVINPTIAGTALSYSSVTNSSLQFAVTDNTNQITGGTVIYSGFFQSNKTNAASDILTIDVSIGSSIAGKSDTLVLAVQPVPHAALAFSASFNYKEQI